MGLKEGGLEERGRVGQKEGGLKRRGRWVRGVGKRWDRRKGWRRWEWDRGKE